MHGCLYAGIGLSRGTEKDSLYVFFLFLSLLFSLLLRLPCVLLALDIRRRRRGIHTITITTIITTAAALHILLLVLVLLKAVGRYPIGHRGEAHEHSSDGLQKQGLQHTRLAAHYRPALRRSARQSSRRKRRSNRRRRRRQEQTRHALSRRLCESKHLATDVTVIDLCSCACCGAQVFEEGTPADMKTDFAGYPCAHMARHEAAHLCTHVRPVDTCPARAPASGRSQEAMDGNGINNNPFREGPPLVSVRRGARGRERERRADQSEGGLRAEAALFEHRGQRQQQGRAATAVGRRREEGGEAVGDVAAAAGGDRIRYLEHFVHEQPSVLRITTAAMTTITITIIIITGTAMIPMVIPQAEQHGLHSRGDDGALVRR